MLSINNRKNGMERLLKISKRRAESIPMEFHRYLSKEIDWKQRLIIITGSRGTGKTTLLLQQMRRTKGRSVYLSLDDFYFETNRFLLLAESLLEEGYRNFFLDEVHQYEHWSKDLKNLNDNFPELQIVATGSSILKIDRGQADLSRRSSLHYLSGLSFREFLVLEYQTDFPVYPLSKILENHLDISTEINDRINILKAFQQYLNYGYYPFFLNQKKDYHQKLQQVIQLITEIDIPSVENINYTTVRSMRKLLYVISQSVPFTPNIQSLSEKIGVSRNAILRVLDLLNRAGVLNLLHSGKKGGSYLQKPEKIFLQNPNLNFTFSGSQPNKGNLRETFFLNQLQTKHNITSSRFGDFMVDNQFTFEVGGATKTDRQIHGIPLAYIASDDIENGIGNKIPLWLFGFLY